MLNFSITDMLPYILVFARMGGMFFMNPVLSRRNIPARFRVALILGLTLLLVPTIDKTQLDVTTDVALIFAIFFELLIGVAFSYVFQIFYYMLFFAGDLLDFQFGLSMAKVFDPGTNIQMSLTGNLLSIMFMLYFFVTDCHLTVIRIMVSSYDIMPIGTMAFSENIISYGTQLFVLVFSMILKLIVPFVVLEFIVEISMGILMKLIPQIHVFVINIQLKVLIAFILLLLLAQPISEFLDRYIVSAMRGAEEILRVLAG